MEMPIIKGFRSSERSDLGRADPSPSYRAVYFSARFVNIPLEVPRDRSDESRCHEEAGRTDRIDLHRQGQRSAGQSAHHAPIALRRLVRNEPGNRPRGSRPGGRPPAPPRKRAVERRPPCDFLPSTTTTPLPPSPPPSRPPKVKSTS